MVDNLKDNLQDSLVHNMKEVNLLDNILLNTQEFILDNMLLILLELI